MVESEPMAARFAWLARICWLLKSWKEFSHDWLGALFSSIDRFVVFVLAAGFAKRASKRESPEGKILPLPRCLQWPAANLCLQTRIIKMAVLAMEGILRCFLLLGEDCRDLP